MGFWEGQPVRRTSGDPVSWRVPAMRFILPPGVSVNIINCPDLQLCNELRDFLDNNFSAYRWSVETIHRLGKIIIAIEKGNIIGCIGGRHMENELWYIDLLCVRDDWRGRGLAGVLNGYVAEACMRSDRRCRILFKIDKEPLEHDIVPVGSWSYWAGCVDDMMELECRMDIPNKYDIKSPAKEWFRIGGWSLCGVGNTISRLWGLYEVSVFDIEGIYGSGDIGDVIRWLAQNGYEWVSITDMETHLNLISALGLRKGNPFWIYAYGWTPTENIIASI